MFELIAIAAAFLVAIVLVKVYPETTMRWFRRIRSVQRIFWAFIATVVSLTLIGTGSPLFMLIGFATLVILAIAAVVDGPLEEVVMD